MAKDILIDCLSYTFFINYIIYLSAHRVVVAHITYTSTIKFILMLNHLFFFASVFYLNILLPFSLYNTFFVFSFFRCCCLIVIIKCPLLTSIKTGSKNKCTNNKKTVKCHLLWYRENLDCCVPLRWSILLICKYTVYI